MKTFDFPEGWDELSWSEQMKYLHDARDLISITIKKNWKKINGESLKAIKELPGR